MASLNLYMHGFVVIPIFIAFQKKNFFEIIIRDNNLNIEELAKIMNANLGPFLVCIKAFEALGWIEQNQGKVSVGKNYPAVGLLPDISRFYSFQLDKLCFDAVDFDLDNFIKMQKLQEFMNETNIESIKNNSYLSKFLDGLVILPLFYILQQRYGNNAGQIILDFLNTRDKNYGLRAFLYNKGFIEEQQKDLVLTASCIGIINSVANSGVTLSYMQLLLNISQLVFGDWKASNELINLDKHINRKINVVGSGAQHFIFFKDSLKMFKNLLDIGDLGNNEITIIDVGCGDGSFLKELYELFATYMSTKLIGIDYNLPSLDKAKEKLNGLPFFLARGNVAYPEEIMKTLKTHNNKDLKNIIHVRTFLDHNRPYVPPKDKKNALNKKAIFLDKSYVDNDGKDLQYSDVLQSLVEYFAKWSNVVAESKGLVTIESHLLPISIIYKYLEQTESLHFDTYHHLSKQLLVQASDYLLCAAEAQLIVDKKFFKKYPTLSPYTRITLQRFTRKDYSIRNAYSKDREELLKLSSFCSPDFAKLIDNALSCGAEGNYVLERNGKLIASLYTCRISREDNLNGSYSNSINGDTIRFVDIHYFPMHEKDAWELVSFVFLQSLVKNGVKKIIISLDNTKNFSNIKNIRNMCARMSNKVLNNGKDQLKYLALDYSSWINFYENYV